MKKISPKTLAVQRALWHHIRHYTRARHMGETTALTFNVSAALVEIRKILPPDRYPTKNPSSCQRMIARMLADGFIEDHNKGGRGKDLRVVFSKRDEVEAWPMK